MRRRRRGAALRLDDLPPGTKTFLHVGCGRRGEGVIPHRYQAPGWREVRADVDPDVEPDIVANIVDLTPVASESMDAIWSSHNLEHVFAHEVPVVLRGFFRVLRPGGELMMTLPDLQAVAKLISAGRLEEVDISPAWRGVAAIDMVYGHRPQIQQGREYMAHRTGFTAGSLERKLVDAGFVDVHVNREPNLTLWALARKPK